MASNKKLEYIQKDWGIKEGDNTAIREAEKKNLQENFMGIQGADSLGKSGNVKEAAAVFTQEGLQLFAQIFSNSVRDAITQTVPIIVKQSVEEQMKEVLDAGIQSVRNMSALYQQTFQNVITSIVPTPVNLPQKPQLELVEDKPTEPTEPNEILDQNFGSIYANEAFEHRSYGSMAAQILNQNEQETSDENSAEKPLRGKERIEHEGGLVEKYLQEKKGEIVSIKQMMKALPQINWNEKNPSNNLYEYMKEFKTIQRFSPGRYFYNYRTSNRRESNPETENKKQENLKNEEKSNNRQKGKNPKCIIVENFLKQVGKPQTVEEIVKGTEQNIYWGAPASWSKAFYRIMERSTHVDRVDRGLYGFVEKKNQARLTQERLPNDAKHENFLKEIAPTVEILKNQKDPLTIKQIVRLTAHVMDWDGNTTAKLNNIMKYHPQLKRIERGMYQYIQG